jgi:hypothetical protein
VILSRDAADTLALRRSTNAQTFNVYNTFGNSTNHERGFLKWSSNTFQVGTEKGSTGGTARGMEFQTDGVTRLTLATNGEATFGSSGAVIISNATTSTSDTTGALRVTGGIASVDNINTRGAFRGLHFQIYNTNGSIEWQARSVTWASPAAGIIEQYSGATAQESRLYGNYTNSTSYQRMTTRSVKQTLSALSGSSVSTTGTLIPDGAVVVGVTTRVATALSGATGYKVGDGTDADRWGDITGTAIGTTSDNSNWTAGSIECFIAGGEVTLTANGSNFAGGDIEVCVFYLAGQSD